MKFLVALVLALCLSASASAYDLARYNDPFGGYHYTPYNPYCSPYSRPYYRPYQPQYNHHIHYHGFIFTNPFCR